MWRMKMDIPADLLRLPGVPLAGLLIGDGDLPLASLPVALLPVAMSLLRTMVHWSRAYLEVLKFATRATSSQLVCKSNVSTCICGLGCAQLTVAFMTSTVDFSRATWRSDRSIGWPLGVATSLFFTMVYWSRAYLAVGKSALVAIADQSGFCEESQRCERLGARGGRCQLRSWRPRHRL